MHQTRAQTNRRIPIARKGTQYVARARDNVKNGVPVVVALRDMIGLAKTEKEVREIINAKAVKLNGKVVTDRRASVKLFNILEADKKYVLSILNTGRYTFEETSENGRLCKVTGKTIVSGSKVQLTMHDGTTMISEEKIAINDSISLGLDGKIKKVIPMKKGSELMIISGKKAGHRGNADEVNGNNVKVNIGGSVTEIRKSQAIAL